MSSLEGTKRFSFALKLSPLLRENNWVSILFFFKDALPGEKDLRETLSIYTKRCYMYILDSIIFFNKTMAEEE